MTEYWVSQGNKWCDFCKIYISNNPAGIRNHELGQRHKDNVAKRLTTMRKEKAEKEKKDKEVAHTLEQIEAKAKRSYQKDVASFEEARDSLELSEGFNLNRRIGDPTVGGTGGTKFGGKITARKLMKQFPFDKIYYRCYRESATGKWVTPEEAYASPHYLSKGPAEKKPTKANSVENKNSNKSQNGTAPGLVVSANLNPKRSAKGAPSSLAVGKRKRPHEKVKVVSEEEKAALKAREAARKRVEGREKPLLGLYRQ